MHIEFCNNTHPVDHIEITALIHKTLHEVPPGTLFIRVTRSPQLRTKPPLAEPHLLHFIGNGGTALKSSETHILHRHSGSLQITFGLTQVH